MFITKKMAQCIPDFISNSVSPKNLYRCEKLNLFRTNPEINKHNFLSYANSLITPVRFKELDLY